MGWVLWLLMLWAVFTCGVVAGSRFAEHDLRRRERQVAARRAELGSVRRDAVQREWREPVPSA